MHRTIRRNVSLSTLNAYFFLPIWNFLLIIDINRICDHQYHEPLHRTQSEEPPRSPYDPNESHHKSVFTHFDNQSRASSRQSDFETSRSDVLSSDHMLTHSRNLSQDSATSYRSMDFSTSKQSQDSVSMMFTHENMAASHSGCIDFMDKITNRSYESNSLPRRKCVYHANDYQTNSLPRKERAHHLRDAVYHPMEILETDSGKVNVNRMRTHGTFSIESTMGSNQNIVDTIKRRYSCGVQESLRHIDDDYLEELQIAVRRNSTNNFFLSQPNNDDDDDDDEIDDDESGSEEYCSTCESDSDSKQEQEIFIDFKPRISPVPSPRSRRKRLQKAVSEGEMLFDNQREVGNDEALLTSASEEDLKIKENQKNNSYLYSNIPIKDEGICDTKNLLKLPTDRDVRNRREAFRKRSISLEEPTGDEEDISVVSKPTKSGPPSPCLDDKTQKDISTFPSSDSLVNDLTRDHSDGIWNESQATILQVEPRYISNIFFFFF